MRVILLLLLCAVARPAGAAEIYGRVYVKGSDWREVRVGYVGKDSDGHPIDCFAGATVEYDGAGSASCTTFKPRTTTLTWAGRAQGVKFRHASLPAGRYIVYVRANDSYIDCRTIDVTKTAAKIQVNLSVKPDDRGVVKFELPKSRDYHIELTPLDRHGLPLIQGVNNTMFPVEVDVLGRNASVVGLRAGLYLVEVNIAHRQGDEKSGWVETYQPLGKCRIEVKAGKCLIYRVP